MRYRIITNNKEFRIQTSPFGVLWSSLLVKDWDGTFFTPWFNKIETAQEYIEDLKNDPRCKDTEVEDKAEDEWRVVT